MQISRIEQVANAILYEGYVLYPYRPSSVKNRQRWTVGALYPEAFARTREGLDPWMMRAECLIECEESATIDVKAGFLQMVSPSLPASPDHDWREAIEQEVLAQGLVLRDLADGPHRVAFDFGGVQGWVAIQAVNVRAGLFRVKVTIANTSRFEASPRTTHSQVQPYALVSGHVILSAASGAFVSMIDPGEPFREAARTCENVGLWPVLVGDEGSRNAMLAAPIILYDYPKIAPESPGDLFDSTEIDEILSLRILTLTDVEKREMAAFDDRARALLDRTEGLDQDQLMKLHAVMRPTWPAPGDRVILRPSRRADAFDLILSGQTATVSTIEQDFENQTYVTVLVDDDPGKDLGEQGRPGHRFFFRADEVERIDPTEGGPP